MLDVEAARIRRSATTDRDVKASLGQYFTSARTAQFMAGMFTSASGPCRLLDAGAGIGSLSAAFIEHWQRDFTGLEIDAFEVDKAVHDDLANTLRSYATREVCWNLHGEDFIDAAVRSLSGDLFAQRHRPYSHAILNPPYKKIGSNSAQRIALRTVGIETVNLYSAFVALAVAMLQPGGQLTAIIPRSFCNGPYYRPFRNFLLERCAIRRIHLFGSRVDAFKDDGVLQENVILHLQRGTRQGPITISYSTNDSFEDLTLSQESSDSVIARGADDVVFSIPDRSGAAPLAVPYELRSLKDLGISVSTGPIVDFRLKGHLRSEFQEGCVPLLYPVHFASGATCWPAEGGKKANAIALNDETLRWLYPKGHYCVVRRLSSKEERRRIVASVVSPTLLPDVELYGFENHLNVFHRQKVGLPQSLASGLAVYLNSAQVDRSFRCFNGHTQVNANDLRLLQYPTLSVLEHLGHWATQQVDITPESIDDIVRKLLECPPTPSTTRLGKH